jgi:hypothetical protein
MTNYAIQTTISTSTSTSTTISIVMELELNPNVHELHLPRKKYIIRLKVRAGS